MHTVDVRPVTEFSTGVSGHIVDNLVQSVIVKTA